MTLFNTLFWGLMCLTGVGGCNETRATAPAPTPTPEPSVSVAATPAARPARPAPQRPADYQGVDTWLVVSKGGQELGVIELAKGKPPQLALTATSDDAKALKTELDAIDGPEGIGLDMHLPPPSGQGRGPYGTKIVKYDDSAYKFALQHKLEPAFDVKEVPALIDPAPPAKFKQLHVSRDGKKVGSIDFSRTPLGLTKAADTGDALGLENNWGTLTKPQGVKVRFHRAKGAGRELITREAKPGDADYAEVATLYLITERYYSARYAYALEYVD